MPKYEGKIPKTLKNWCEKNADKLVEVCCGGGYSTDSSKAYDILLAPGWSAGYDHVHTLIEPNINDMLRELRAIKPCDCRECLEMLKDAADKKAAAEKGVALSS